MEKVHHPYRQLMLSELTSTNSGAEVRVAGWVHSRRDHGQIVFIDLRDRSGLLQVVFDPTASEKAHQIASQLRQEFVISVVGTVRERPMV